MRLSDVVFIEPEVPEIEDNYTLPLSPGGTTTQNQIETVTVQATRLPNYRKYLAILAVFLATYLLLRRKAR